MVGAAAVGLLEPVAVALARPSGEEECSGALGLVADPAGASSELSCWVVVTVASGWLEPAVTVLVERGGRAWPSEVEACGTLCFGTL